MNAIETKGLRYVYEDGTVALNSMDFHAPQGQITGILGANGAGKSTLFLNLNGVLHPAAGEVYITGQKIQYDHKGRQALRQKVGIVFQDPDDQLFSADVYRDISFGAVNLGLPQDEVRQRVEQAMQCTGIAALRDKPTHALSYGQKKRVAIAGVMVMQPEIMILDEPTAGLDPQGVSEIMHLCVKLRKDYGMTIVLATHDMDIVPLYCDYTFLLAQGSMIAQGTPQQLFQDPARLRQYHLRLPRLAHLMEVLKVQDGLAVDVGAATISAARREILRLVKRF